jgi:hypothetical protein
MSTQDNQAGQEDGQKDNLTSAITEKGTAGVTVVVPPVADQSSETQAAAAAPATPAATQQTTKVGKNQQNALKAQQDAVKARQNQGVTLVKATTTQLPGGAVVRESTAEQVTTYAESAAWKKAVEVASPSAKSALGQIAGYIDAMAPNKSQVPSGLWRQQSIFYNALMTILIQERDHFAEVWAGVVAAVRANLKGCFAIQYCQRGIDSAPDQILDPAAIRVLTRLIQLLRVDAQTGGNQTLLRKNVDIAKAIEPIVNKGAREKLTRYYSAE